MKNDDNLEILVGDWIDYYNIISRLLKLKKICAEIKYWYD